VRKKFEGVAGSCWDKDDFPEVIAAAYTGTPRTDRSLRDILVQISQAHIKELMQDEQFLEVLHETTDFAADLVKSFVRSGLLLC
jgi:predicted MPP superfamily phosphohydrolase